MSIDISLRWRTVDVFSELKFGAAGEVDLLDFASQWLRLTDSLWFSFLEGCPRKAGARR